MTDTQQVSTTSGNPEANKPEAAINPNLNRDMVTVITEIKAKIKKINEEERLKMPEIKFIPMEDIVLDQISDSDMMTNSNKKKSTAPAQYNILLKRQQQLHHRKNHIVNPIALEGRARQLLGANSEERLRDVDMEERLARSKADRYYKVSESDNLFNDLGLETFQKQWGKLEAHLKINRLMKYAETLQIERTLDEASFKDLRITLIDAVNNRKITRKNDVQYNEELGQVMDIRGLSWDEEVKRFTYDPDQKTSSKKVKKTTDRSPEVDQESEVEKVTSLRADQIDLLARKQKILIEPRSK